MVGTVICASMARNSTMDSECIWPLQVLSKTTVAAPNCTTIDYRVRARLQLQSDVLPMGVYTVL